MLIKFCKIINNTTKKKKERNILKYKKKRAITLVKTIRQEKAPTFNLETH